MNDADGVTIVIRADDSDIDRLAACLKTLEINPPCVACDVVIVVPNPSPACESMVSSSKSIKIISHAQSHCGAMNMIARGSSKRWLLFCHPDTLFISDIWSDSCLSRLVSSGLAAMGAQPMESIDGPAGKATCISDWFLLTERSYFEAVGGFPEEIGLHGGAFILQMRMMAKAMMVAGADLSDLVVHMKSCSKERIKPTEMEVSLVRASISNLFPQ